MNYYLIATKHIKVGKASLPFTLFATTLLESHPSNMNLFWLNYCLLYLSYTEFLTLSGKIIIGSLPIHPLFFYFYQFICACLY
ncbi:unnamed protein product, partial [Vitis vinifera]|uniref:Uncharacterized protein n=1 Tax=Vitis vinifera TaxID=29760 RepID=D7T2B5_VITVI